MKKTIIIAIPLLVIGLIVMLYGGYRYNKTNKVYKEADRAYNDMTYHIKRRPTADSLPATGETGTNAEFLQPHGMQDEIEYVQIPYFDIDYDALQMISEDAVAWLYAPDSVIDYPVMKATDYYYYLNHLPNGTANANGSLFIDFNNSSDFTDELTVIYGHHMRSGSMFGNLKDYKEQAYYENNPYMYLYTENGNYRVDLLYGSVIGAGVWRDHAFMYAENLQELLDYVAENTTFIADFEYREGDRILALSTCSYEFNNARYLVVGILRDAVMAL